MIHLLVVSFWGEFFPSRFLQKRVPPFALSSVPLPLPKCGDVKQSSESHQAHTDIKGTAAASKQLLQCFIFHLTLVNK